MTWALSHCGPGPGFPGTLRRSCLAAACPPEIPGGRRIREWQHSDQQSGWVARNIPDDSSPASGRPRGRRREAL